MIDLANLDAVIQSKVDALGADTDPKALLLLSKAIEAAVGSIAVNDIIIQVDAGVASVQDAAAAAATTQLTAVNQAGADKLAAVNQAGTDKLTAIAATDSVKIGRHTLWIPASSMTVRTTGGAGYGTTETSSAKLVRKTLDFDTASQEYAQFTIAMPKSWDRGAVAFQALWTALGGSGGVAWTLQGVALSDGDAMDAAFGTAVAVTDSLTAAGALHLTATGSGVTIAGSPAAEDMVVFQVSRAVANAADTLAQDALLLGIRLYYTINAATDA